MHNISKNELSLSNEDKNYIDSKIDQLRERIVQIPSEIDALPPKSTPTTHEGEVISNTDIGSKISSLKDKIDQLSPKIDSLPLSPPLSSMIPNPQDCSIFLSDRDINHIDSKIDALRDSIVQLSPRGEAECPHYENMNEATYIELNPG